MSKFKEALERGKEARNQKGRGAENARAAERNVPVADFEAQARAWLDDVVVASLQAANAEVAGEVAFDIDTASDRLVKASTPSMRFEIYRKRQSENAVRRMFTVSVEVSGAVSVSAPGMVAKDVGNIGDKSDAKFRNLVAELIEEAAKGT
ncbi:hypothetical protein EN858_11105 [Mesorhizobium sp. M4B.F.Ca.ET.215.01.1.1]|uniref:hypothetical protein n=2 Tax=Mesorhizobium TaxID=68287 RepID=UPI000FCAB0A6|nr:MULTISPECIES: hypothetical protein [unclassified Mesorhizobium]RUW23369.1 hypothetical protein EOA34_18435 [Mesorhizobium sp. M4B.F.Ca.ET.013.02.1.1]RVD37276.1 hypothetical protein EN741_23785 [Mesorhizobium sp. M4B.F.Ca.ET.019.03.1.1]RWF61369.1 MAG: hypothetical protein EOS47_28390 [Mesorhizobium sp.]TGQ12965.1 hypothetical protein EN858_11105 [Mesorhizobium sp. M4B.F.Ca.ET.215.01.1.1]TGQ43279.1 hypothetical protein EN857_03955 [Mesorhizobium sp. M4B.F.Ca.ET.214.01.1.1]